MLINRSVTDKRIAQNVIEAQTSFSRFIGLMGKKNFPNRAMIIQPCNQIHTWFMRMPIDVLFVNDHHQVVYKIVNLSPWRVSPKVAEALYVVEAEAGKFSNDVIRIGDYIEWVKEEMER